MGFSRESVRFLAYCRRHGVDFSSSATLGRQVLYLNARELRSIFARNGEQLSPSQCDAVFQSGQHYAEPLLHLLGARVVDSFDASSYENASHVVDFNNPLLEKHKGQYTTVIDGGSLEHVFNYPQGLKNAMEMVRPGGHLILITPTHSRSGHGFYQLSAELFHRAFSESNGYESPEIFLCAANRDAWYRVADAEKTGTRVVIDHRRYWDHLFVVARRTRVAPIFDAWPQQSDYASAWTRRQAIPASAATIRERLRANRHRIPRALLRLYSLWFSPRSSRLERVRL